MNYRGKIINDIAEAVGEDVAILVHRHYAGKLLYISSSPKSALAKTIGVKNAKKLYDAYGRDTLRIPLGDTHIFAVKKKQFMKLIGNKKTVLSAQAECGISERTAWNWKSQYDNGTPPTKQAEPPLPLFDE